MSRNCRADENNFLDISKLKLKSEISLNKLEKQNKIDTGHSPVRKQLSKHSLKGGLIISGANLIKDNGS